MKNKTAVVTGAGGFIGSALCKTLLLRNYKVYGVDIINDDELVERIGNNKNFIPVCIDLKKDSLSDLIKENVDVLFYLCWGGSLSGEDLYNEELQLVNVSTAVKVCKDASSYCKHFIFGSSSYEFMKSANNVDINTNVYGISKGVASKMCASVSLRNKMDFNKAILTNTYGKGDRSRKAVNTLIYKLLKGQQLELVEGEKPNDWVYIEDTVRGLIDIYEKGKSYKDYYIGHQNITTFKEKITIMRDLLSPKATLNFGTFEDSNYVDYNLVNLVSLYEDTGFECEVSFEDGIKKTAEWVRDFSIFGE
ncbi:MAG: NAD(P)-dependent oxidoreductase [Ruminiclostridium sp.]|nr:NAD(P)-dependent oxidoreductase [Ruminiclostridium sp.]